MHLRSLREAVIKEQRSKTIQPKIIILAILVHLEVPFPQIINLASAPHLPQHSKLSVAPPPHVSAGLLILLCLVTDA
jgi:hypothetical protein